MSLPPSPHVPHRVRHSAFDPDTTWTLRETELWIEPEGRQASIVPLAAFRRISLLYDPSRFQPNRFRCVILCLDGRTFTFRNEHYVGFSRFEDRSPSYRRLVTALCRRVASANPGCSFACGKSQAAYWIQLAFLSLALVVLLVILAIAWTAIGWVVVLKLALFILMMPMLVRWITRNRPGSFDPAKPPERLLPPAVQP